MKGYSVFLIALFSLFEGKEGLNFVKQPSSEIQVVKPGDSLVIDCVGDTEISLCQWRHHKTMIIKAESNNYRRVGDSRTSCSLEIVSVRDEDHGDWYCVPIAEDVSGDLPESNVAKIVVAKKPESFGMVSAERVITTQEDIELELTCMAHSSRPAAKIKWYIGEGSKKPIDSKLVIETITKDNPKNDASTVTVESILKYKFSGPENGKQLRCVAEHVGYQDGREEDNKMLDIEFGPKFTNDNEPAFYFQPETDAEIKVNFTAHPKPFFLEWIIDKLAVKPENNPRSEKYETLTIKDIPHEQDKYQAYLKIKSINEEDVSKSYTLKLHDYQSKFAEYPVKLYLGEKPLQGGRIYVPVSGPGDLSGGAVAGIVIAIIAIVLLLAIIILAKRSRTLCFSDESGDKETALEAGDGDSEPGRKAKNITETFSNVLSRVVNPAKKEKNEEQEKIPFEEPKKPEVKFPEETPLAEKEPEDKDPQIIPTNVQPRSEGVVYAELDLKGSSKPMKKLEVKENTEYAEIIGTLQENEPKK